ncbi:AraC family transcriptional regulator [Aeromonas hydrophila]|uniref:helix-turn-helix domain-containing protein n=1 Tax=Aeromonas hydrophila TaxID=644 RepID=UPI0009B8D0F2|nr:AraC family transcriptional regulator [Aeromonas hydrophila]WDA23115.1 AraC family transcriptional regulator [Aeromonas hydrophila]WES93178.1 AraC family transcriptional regulator [Aeromonas hydrophila]
MCSNDFTVFSLAQMAQLYQSEEKSIIIQPGLAVSICHSNCNCLNASFPSDDKYIHLNYLLEGCFKARVRDTLIELNEGDAIIGFVCGEPFHLINSPSFCNLDIMIKPELLATLVENHLLDIDLNDVDFFIKPPCNNIKLKSTANNIASLVERPTCKLLLHSAVLEFIHWQLNAFKEKHNNQGLSIREKYLLESARNYLLKDLSIAPTIADIASVVGLNQCKLKKGFKQMYGDSIYAHYQKERMKKAMKLLKFNNVTETAMILGYSNVSHFSAAFSKEFNIKPKEARKEIIPSSK